MGKPHQRDWVRTLDEIEAAVRGCLTALDRYEARFHTLLADDPRPPADRRLPEPRAGWTERLAAAHAETAAVEQLLADQEAAWTRWRQALSSWRQSVEQSPGRDLHTAT